MYKRQTGGLVAGTLVNADGISEVFKESYITYSNEAKHKLLGVKEETLKMYGAVSRLSLIHIYWRVKCNGVLWCFFA